MPQVIFSDGASCSSVSAGIDTIRVDKAPGSPARELTWDDLRGKFMDCARSVRSIQEARAEQAFAAIQSLESAPDIRELVDLLR